jgi:hypothetical protein
MGMLSSKSRERQVAMWLYPCVEQVSYYFFICRTRKTLTHTIETYLHPQDFEWQTQGDIPMELVDTDIEDNTPKPKEKGKSATQFRVGSEEENSQVESEEDFYATPKALQKKRPTVHRDSSLDPDFVDITNDSNTDSLGQAEWKSESDLEVGEENGESDIEIIKNGPGKHKAPGKPKVSKTIDLAKMQKPRGAKEKRAFRMEVEERRATIVNGDGKKETVSDCSFNVNVR